jgi:hypothetical protein
VLVAVGVAGIVATAVPAWAVANSPILVDRSGDVIWRSLFVAAYVAVGEYTWWRRPERWLGPIVAGSGFLYSVTSLNASGAPVAYTLGIVAWAVYIVYAGYMSLCFPRGRLEPHTALHRISPRSSHHRCRRCDRDRVRNQRRGQIAQGSHQTARLRHDRRHQTAHGSCRGGRPGLTLASVDWASLPVR